MNAADQLGKVQAKIAQLREEERILKGEVLEEGGIEGAEFKATVIASERTKTNWKKIATDLGASARKIASNSSKSLVLSVKVTARPTAARRAA